MRRRWLRLLIPLMALMLAVSAAGPYRPVPSDAELKAMVDAAVAAQCTFVNDAVHEVRTEVNITRMHLETSSGDSVRMNRIVVDLKKVTGPYSDGASTTLYVLMWAGIGEAPPPYKFWTETSGKTRQAGLDAFNARMSQWLPDRDLRPVAGHGETPAPELPLCNATISLPRGLKAGDTLAPDATVISVDGAPVKGSISIVWTINGAVANSVTWNGQPARIILQLSCQGHAQEFTATYNGTLNQAPGQLPGQSSAPGPSGDTGPSGTRTRCTSPGPSRPTRCG